MVSVSSRLLVPALLLCLGGVAAAPGAAGEPERIGPDGTVSSRAAGHPKVVQIVAGGAHSVVVGSDGRVYGTGSNLLGQLTGPHRARRGLILVRGLPEGVAAAAVAGGRANSLVVGDDGTAYGAGLNENGQLTGVKARWHRLHPLAGLPEGVRAVRVASGRYHSLVLGDDGVAYGAGDGWSGQLTGAPRNKVRTLVPLSGLPEGVRAEGVAAGDAFSLVLGDNGVVYGTGSNAAGQLTGVEANLRTLTPLGGLPAAVSATAIDATARQSLVVGADGVAYGAGRNQVGQLTGVDNPRRILAPLTGLPAGVQARAVAAGSKHSLVLGDDRRVYGTGSNVDGELTRGPDFRLALTPFRVLRTGVEPVAVAAGDRHSLMLGDDGRLYGTGANGAGQVTGPVKEWHMWVSAEWGFANLVHPAIVGKPLLGRALTSRHGRWWPTPSSYAYRWYRNGELIPRATSRRHVVVKADLGARLRVRVTVSRRGIRPATRLTTAIGIPAPHRLGGAAAS